MRRILIAALALLPLALAGCSTTHPPKWIDGSVEAGSERILWQVTVLALEQSGFPIGSGLEPGKLVAVSGWRNSMAPFRGDGYRERCHVQFTPLSGRNWSAKVRVERERNDDIHRPLDVTYADWQSDPDNEERARIVLRRIKSLLGGSFELAR